MRELYELKELLCEELKEYGSKEKLDVGGLEIVDKLAHAIKNIDKIIEAYEEEEYSEEGGSYARGGNRGGGNRRYSRAGNGGSSYTQGGGGSYARGRGRGSSARRDSMGRYSREGGYSRGGPDEMAEQLQEMMQEAPNEQIRMELERVIAKLEQM